MTPADRALEAYLASPRYLAEQELAREDLRANIEAEKARILKSRNRSLWQRLTAWLPFTFTIHRKSK